MLLRWLNSRSIVGAVPGHVVTRPSRLPRGWMSVTGLLLILVLATGCRFPCASVRMLENELRWMEDQMYEMEDQLDQACVDLERARRDSQRQLALCESQCGSPDRHLAPIADPGLSFGDEMAPHEIIMPDGQVIPDVYAPQEMFPPESSGDSMMFPVDEANALPGEIEVDELPAPISTQYPTEGPNDDTASPEPTPALESRPDSPSSLIPDDALLDAPTPDGSMPGALQPDQPKPEILPPNRRPTIETTPSGIEPSSDLPSVDSPSDPGLESFFNSPPAAPPSGSGIDTQSSFSSPAHPEAKEEYSIRLQSHVTTESIDDANTRKPNVDAHITHIVIQAERTARSAHGAGHDLQVLVQPRNADGNYVSLPAKVSLVVLDDERKGEESRVARWDFDASEISRLFRKTERGSGIHFELDWPEDKVPGDQLHLYVRYTTVDGRKLQARQFLEPPGTARDDANNNVPGKEDHGWTVVGREKPVPGWSVIPIGDESTDAAIDDSSASHTRAARIEKASAMEDARDRSTSTTPTAQSVPQSAWGVDAGQWSSGPLEPSGSDVPGLLPSVDAEPMPGFRVSRNQWDDLED